MTLFKFAFLFLGLSISWSQDLLEMIDSDAKKENGNVFATFKGNRLINHHTVETPGKRALDFRIAHRFDDMSKGIENFFGLDGPASILLSFDYGITDRLAIGIGRTNLQKMAHGFVKYKLLSQTQGDVFPNFVTVTLISQCNAITEIDRLKTVNQFDRFERLENRLSFFNQLAIARKFNEKLSLQLSPMLVHHNLVELNADGNSIAALGFSGRYKLSKRMAVTAEYSATLNEYSANQKYYNPISFGVDIETGGHVFQMFFSNAFGINEAQFVPYTTHDWAKREFRLGFNVSRVFGL